MIEVRAVTADEMILAFVRAEIDSPTDRGQLFMSALLLARPDRLGFEQFAVASPPPSSGGNHSVSGHVYPSALSKDASLHQQRRAKKVCLADA
jgi:hypothetical protein